MNKNTSKIILAGLKKGKGIFSLILTLVVIWANIAPVIPVNAAAQDSLLADYPLVSDANDTSGNENDGTDASRALEEIEIVNPKEIRGNITLPTENSYDAQITWKSSNPAVISDQEVENEDYDNIPAGVVTRQEVDTLVTLTATAKVGNAASSKEFSLIVKAEAGEKDLNSYLFTYFPDNNHEQIYFATGSDGFNYEDLNSGQPVLESDIGDQGVRDPYVFRSPEGDKFYMIATDLKVQTTGWSKAQYDGSLNLVVWESYDLVNWSEPRLADVGMGSYENIGCVWAPEAYYDELTGEYIVFWASMTGVEGTGITNVRQIVYYSKTRDFVNFTKAEQYIDRGDRHIIDTSMIKASDGKYYRVSADGEITIETSDTILGEWTEISNLRGLSAGMNGWSTFKSVDGLTLTGGVLEGPELFQFNGEDKWGLYSDNYTGKGYIPITTTDLSDTTGSAWTIYTSGQYNFGSMKKRHGSILGITQEEYNSVMRKWGGLNDGEEEMVTVIYKQSANGTIQGFTKQSIVRGSDAEAVTAVANKGYRFVRWSDGVDTARRSDTAVTSDITVAPIFEKEVTIQYKAGTGGTINGTATQTILKGGNAETVTAVADTDYAFVRWDDGVTTASRTDENVTADRVVTALFDRKLGPLEATGVNVNLNKKTITLGRGESFTLTAIVVPTGGTSQKVTWSSDKPSVVKVEKGKITAKKTGKATITATTANGKKATCQVTVKKAPKKKNVKIAYKSKVQKTITLKRGQTVKLKAKLTAGFASYKLTWKSSSPKKVKLVSSSGKAAKIKALKKGKTAITVTTFNKKKATIKIIVK